jgi:hypothetical protein
MKVDRKLMKAMRKDGEKTLEIFETARGQSQTNSREEVKNYILNLTPNNQSVYALAASLTATGLGIMAFGSLAKYNGVDDLVIAGFVGVLAFSGLINTINAREDIEMKLWRCRREYDYLRKDCIKNQRYKDYFRMGLRF